MKLLYNQKENYIKHIKEHFEYIFEMFNDMGKPEQAEEAYNKMVTKRTKQLDEVLTNGIDTGGLVKNIEQINDITYDEESYDESVKNNYHENTFYFMIKRGNNNLLFDADLVLSRL